MNLHEWVPVEMRTPAQKKKEWKDARHAHVPGSTKREPNTVSISTDYK